MILIFGFFGGKKALMDMANPAIAPDQERRWHVLNIKRFCGRPAWVVNNGQRDPVLAYKTIRLRPRFIDIDRDNDKTLVTIFLAKLLHVRE